MINWTTDERTTALMKQAVRHFKEFDELSLKLEVQMDAIREEYLTDLWFDFRSEDTDAFEEWHNQPTVEEFVASGRSSASEPRSLRRFRDKPRVSRPRGWR
jgi:hypothetical protein